MQRAFKSIGRAIGWPLNLLPKRGARSIVVIGACLSFCILLSACASSDSDATAIDETDNSRSSSEVADAVESAETAPTETPLPTHTPTATPEPEPLIEVDVNSANIRSGPGTGYAPEGAASGGEQYEVLATNETGDWYLIGDNGRTVGWIAASIVTQINPDAIEQVAVAATIPAVPAAANQPAAPAAAPTNPPTAVPAAPVPTTAAASVPPTATSPPAPQPGEVVIIGVNKRAEYVDLQNIGGSPVDLAGWRLVSEKGNQDCSLGGVIQPNATLRVWAKGEDSGNGGFNCGFSSNIWNNSDSDPAVLYDASGAEVSRR